MVNRRSRLRAAMLAAALTVTALPGPVGAADPDKDWLPDLVESTRIDGPTLLRGQLVNKGGNGTPGRVMVFAWPRMAVLAALKDGDPVKTLAVGKTRTDQSGNFVIKVDPNVPIAEFMEADGTVNFDVRAFDEAKGSLQAFGRTLNSNNGARWNDAASTKLIDAEQAPVTLALDQDLPAPNGIPAPEPVDKLFPCPDYAKATYNQVTTIVGEVYTGPNATGDYKYETSASSTLGVAVTSSIEDTSFSAGGTATASSTSGINFPTQAVNKKTVFQTTFQYKKFEVWISMPPAPCMAWRMEVRPTAFQGGASSYTAASAPTATNCSTVSTVPTTLWKETATAVTFSNSVKIKGYIGIDLSGSTGFTNKARISFTFSKAGKLCGTNAAWPQANRVVGK